MNKKNLSRAIREVGESHKKLKAGDFNEPASLSKKVYTELQTLIKNIQAGKGVDERAMESNTDGELLAIFLNGAYQSALMKLKDRKGFKREFKI